jgi:hypothetical protein
MKDQDLDYFRRRMREEREAAAQAAPPASLVHQELADKYANVVAAYARALGGPPVKDS